MSSKLLERGAGGAGVQVCREIAAGDLAGRRPQRLGGNGAGGWEQLPAAEQDAILEEYRALGADLHASGHYVGGSQLAPSTSATTVRVRNDRLSVVDGPFAETKEQLGGYFLIEARDLNDAIQVARRIPSARFGTVEVRPLIPSPSMLPVDASAASDARAGAPA